MSNKQPKSTGAIQRALDAQKSDWAKMAEALGLNRQTVHNWKKSGVPPDYMEAVAKFTGIDVARLFALQYDFTLPGNIPVLSEDALRIAEQYESLPPDARLLVNMWLDGLRGVVRVRGGGKTTPA